MKRGWTFARLPPDVVVTQPDDHGISRSLGLLPASVGRRRRGMRASERAGETYLLAPPKKKVDRERSTHPAFSFIGPTRLPGDSNNPHKKTMEILFNLVAHSSSLMKQFQSRCLTPGEYGRNSALIGVISGRSSVERCGGPLPGHGCFLGQEEYMTWAWPRKVNHHRDESYFSPYVRLGFSPQIFLPAN